MSDSPPPNQSFAASSSTPSPTKGGDGAPPAKPLQTPRQPSHPRERAYQLVAIFAFGDWLLSTLAVFTGLLFRAWQKDEVGQFLSALSNPLGTQLFALLLAGALVVWLQTRLGNYDVANLYRLRRWSKSMLKCIAIWVLAMPAFEELVRVHVYAPRLGLLYTTILIPFFLGCWRLLLYPFIMQPSVKHAASRRIIVVGWSEQATHLRRVMRMDLAELGEIIGCVPAPGGHFTTKPPSELAVLGDYSRLPAIVHETGAHAIVLADMSAPVAEVHHLINFCQRELLRFQMIPSYFPALRLGLKVESRSGVPLLGVTELPLDRTLNRVTKRFVDIIGGIVGLLGSLPITALFAFLVYIESPGPVIYRQKRASRSGRLFTIYKIRSMRLTAEAESGAVWCKQNDNRRLKVGAFMRKYNIDELPQFINVLRGDLSLVGPRPERPELIAKFKHEIPNYNARHEARAGLTGWAQIHGLRGDTDLRERINHDLWYLERWSLGLDFYIIVCTFFKNKNAH